MVLPGATSDDAGGDSFTPDHRPTSDIDPYASSSSSSSSSSPRASNGQQYNIRIDQLPKPFFLFNLSSNDNDRAMYRTIVENCAHAQSILHRPLRQDEVDAIGFHFAKSIRIVSYGLPAGFLMGGVWAYRGMKDFSFPFWTPKEGSKFNPEVFGPIRGGLARAMWQGLRFNIYGFIGGVAGTLFFSTYATTVNAVGTGTDPRLHDYIEAYRKMSAEQRGQVMQRPVGQRNPVESQEGQMDRQAMGAARRVGAETSYSRSDIQRRADAYGRQSTSNKYGDSDDDASPTGGAFTQDFKYYEEGGSPTDSGLLDDAQTEQRARDMQRPDQRSRRAQESFTNYGDDDASPTAASSPFTDKSSAGPGGKGSTWDRIRSNAAHSSPSSSSPASRAQAWPTADETNRSGLPQSSRSSIQREQNEGSTLGDSFAFSTSDEERQLAKSEAQKDFDARVERERHGGDFTQSSGGVASSSSSSGGSGSSGQSAWERLRK